MRIGVPKEIKVHEYRVGLTPDAVAELTALGHSVVVETNAGKGVDFLDADYVAAGATIAVVVVIFFISFTPALPLVTLIAPRVLIP